MNGQKLEDRLHLGLGVCARHIGRSADAFRPSGASDPLAPQNRFLRLPAVFVSAKGNADRTNVYGEALWHGIFDASYTRAGDYLVMATGSYFVVSQEPLLPILCAKSNRIISVARPNMQTAAASNPYGGFRSSNSMTLIAEWPAVVLGEGRSSASTVGLPTDQASPNWNVLLPAIGNLLLSPGDLITDDLNRSAIITASELTTLGWRISARMATT